jgi:hypothetical protein
MGETMKIDQPALMVKHKRQVTGHLWWRRERSEVLIYEPDDNRAGSWKLFTSVPPNADFKYNVHINLDFSNLTRTSK